MIDDSPSPDEELAAFIAATRHGDVPEVAQRAGERAFVDTVGVALGGASEPAVRKVRRVFGTDGNAALASATSTSVPEAALVNGTAGHALDYDDVTWGVWHPSVTLIPAILAVGESVGASGEAALTAYAVGFEVECYLAERLLPGHYEVGWHATATFGTLGATAAVASILDLDRGATRHALNASASMAAGLKRNFGSMTKPLHAGLTARSATTASLLAAEGFTATDGTVGYDRGFLDLYDGDERLMERTPLGRPWGLTKYGLQVKKYPCCYFTHPAIAATEVLTDTYDVDPSDVESISVTASRGAADALHYATPETGLESKFSMEYAVAAGVVEETVGLKTFSDGRVGDPDIDAVRELVDFRVDPEQTYDPYETTVVVETTDKERYARTQKKPPGTPENPLTESELRAKFEETVAYGSGDVPTAKLYTMLDDLRAVADVGTVIGHLGSSDS